MEKISKRKIIWDTLRGKEIDYTTGSIQIALIALGIPMMLEMVMESLFAIVDIFFVTKISANRGLHCNGESGVVDISDQQSTLFAKPTGIESP